MSNKIRSKLVALGITNRSIADELDVTPAAITRVIKDQSKSARIRQAIADKLGTTPAKLWKKAA